MPITLRFLFGTVLLVVALVLPGLGIAATGILYVDRGNPSCSDAGTGLPTQPFCTIGAAAKKVAAGQTVEVASGTYPEAVTMVTSGTSASPISFTTALGATVTVSGKANGIASPRTKGNIRVDKNSTSGTTMDDDLVHLTEANEVLLIWGSTSYYSLAAFQAGAKQEARGIQADPLWTNPFSGDFQLTAGSPAIDSANSGASGQPSTDADGHARVDDPATPNTGVGPRAFDDRGAYEFQLP